MTDFVQDHPKGVIVAMDQMSRYFQATVTRVWSPIGQTPVIRISPQRDHIHFYGALEVRVVAPGWLRDWAAPEWYTRYSQPLTTFRLPEKTEEREALAVQIGWDGWTLMETIYHDPTTPAAVRELEAVEILRQVWVQQYALVEGELRWRE